MSESQRAGPHAGLPLLSGPAPDYPDLSESSCRRCQKGLNAIFTRSRKCNHCGYAYCHSCTDYTALMPRNPTVDFFSQGPGHDIVQVCANCIRYLSITAKSKDQLKRETLSKLKEYASVYHIPVNGVVEKDDLIDRLISARDRGCLKHQYEEYYRANSVPGRSEPRRGSIFRGAGHAGPSQSQSQPRPNQPRPRTTSHPASFPRPDLEPDSPPSRQQRESQYGQNSSPRSQQAPPTPPRYNPPPGPPPGYNGMPQFTSRTGTAAQANLNVPNPPRPRSTSVPRNPPPPVTTPRATSPSQQPQPVPSLASLLEMSSEQLSGLSIGTLKTILFRNHVNVGSVLEKSDLVSKVKTLVEDERAEAADAIRRAVEEEREMWAMHERAAQHDQEEQERREQRQTASSSGNEDTSRSSESDHAPPPLPPDEEKPKPASASAAGGKVPSHNLTSVLERTGLCVICQDEEANIAIVDCGHLALCRACSDLVMSGSRECPLCRTRIVTEARLLRIFKS